MLTTAPPAPTAPRSGVVKRSILKGERIVGCPSTLIALGLLMQPLSSCEIIISRLLVLKALGLDFQCRRGVVVKAVTNTTAISAQVNVRRTMKVVGNIEFQVPSPNIVIYLLV